MQMFPSLLEKALHGVYAKSLPPPCFVNLLFYSTPHASLGVNHVMLLLFHFFFNEVSWKMRGWMPKCTIVAFSEPLLSTKLFGFESLVSEQQTRYHELEIAFGSSAKRATIEQINKSLHKSCARVEKVPA